jgi:hypothetical protein
MQQTLAIVTELILLPAVLCAEIARRRAPEPPPRDHAETFR